MIDADLVDNETEFSAALLLAGLLTHDLIHTYRYADDGPPESVPLTDFGWAGEAVPGWVVTTESEPGLATHQVVRARGDIVGRSGIVGQDVLGLIELDLPPSGAYCEIDPKSAAERRRQDAVAALTAESISADLYITNREYLHDLSWSLAKSVTFLTLDDALPLVSLYLRTQGEFLVWKGDSGTHRFNRGLFYWVGTRELLPEGWRWFGACVLSDSQAEDSPMTLLAQSALQRVDRALELRDHVHRAMNQPQGNDVADDALLAFDSCLVFLMGALDAVARVAHLTLRLKSNLRNAGWQRKDWYKEIATVCPAVTDIVGPHTASHQALTVLTRLRNTVHSTGLTSIAFSTSTTRRERTLIDLTSGMDSADRGTLNVAIQALGGDVQWAVDRSLPGRILADPGVVIDRLFTLVIDLINALMAVTPVENLSNVSLAASDLAVPSRSDDVFRKENGLSIRWQLGL